MKGDNNDCYRAKCSKCQVTFISELTSIKNHAKSMSHKIAVKNTPLGSQSCMSSFVNRKSDPIDEQVKIAEIKLASFLAEHNIAFLVIDHLEPLLKSIFPDSEICQKIKMKRTKATNIIKHVIAPVEKKALSNDLNSTKFSVMIDESTDIACVSSMCVVVRYNKDNGVVTKFWDLLPIYNIKNPEQINAGATAENIFINVINSFKKHNVNVDNIIGFGSDGCSTMMGKNNSVSTRMKEMFPGVFVMQCICHSIHLCSSEACKSLPRRLEDFARNVYNFFSNSSKRQSQFVEFQTFLNLDVHKILHPSQTRWLSLFNVVERLLEQWDALYLFFSEKWLSEKLLSAEAIFNQLNDPFTKGYFYFLEWILPKFTTLNQYFQTDRIVLNTLHEKMEISYKDLLTIYMERDYVLRTPVSELDPSCENKFLKHSDIYLGVKIMNHVLLDTVKRRQDLLSNFYVNCIQFLKNSCVQIKKRYNFSDPILPLLSIITPCVALSTKKRSEYNVLNSILPLTKKLPRLVNNELLQVIDDQWRLLSLVNISEDIVNEKEPDKFWILIKNLESEEFKDLATFALSVMSLPHSNACCERIFSKVNRIKTKSRNKLIIETVSATILVSESIKKYENCYNNQPSKELLNSMTSANLYPSKSNFETEENDDFVLCD